MLFNKYSLNISRLPFYYGYVIIVCGTVGVLAGTPGQALGFAIFNDYLVEELDVSRDTLGLAYMLGTLVSTSLLTYAGKLFDRFGARITSAVAAILFAISFLYMASLSGIVENAARVFQKSITEVVQFAVLVLGFFFLRFFGEGVLTTASRNMVMKWFDKRRGIASAALGILTSLAFSFLPYFYDWGFSTFGWVYGWYGIAIIVGIIFVSFAIIFYRDNPQAYGLIPDGKIIEELDTLVPAYHPKADYTLKQARATYSFWIFNFALAMHVTYGNSLTFHVVDVFSAAGLQRTEVWGLFLPTSIVAIAVQLIGGYIVDYVKIKYLLILELCGIGLSMFGLWQLGPGWPVWLIVVGNGIAAGLFWIVSNVTWPRFFGTKHLGEIAGYNMRWLIGGAAVGPLFFSKMFGWYGNYSSAGLVCLIITIILLVLSFKADNVNLSES